MTGESEGEPRPFPQSALRRDRAAVEFDELANNARTDAQATLLEAELPRGMPTWVELGEEGLKQSLEGSRFEADPLVGDDDLHLVLVDQSGRQAELASVGGELDRVGEEVLDDVGDLGGVHLELTEIVGDPGLEVLVASFEKRVTRPTTSSSSKESPIGCALSVWRKSSARIKVSVPATSLPSCRAE